MKKKNQKINLGIVGGTGKLGAKIIELARERYKNKINVCCSLSSQSTEQDKEALLESDVIIDVSVPVVCAAILKDLQKRKKKIPYIVGCTGWSEAEFKTVTAYSKKACLLHAPNFSFGVSLF